MRHTRILALALLGVLLAIPAMAQISIGFGTGRGGFYPGLYNPYYGGSFVGPLGYRYLDPYPVYRSPQIHPRGGVPMIPGAFSFIDEGDFRNYRDRAGNYLGRMPLSAIPSHRW
jgi:hypothetical protein